MPHPTKCQKYLKKICKTKKAKRQYTRSYDNIEDPDNDNISFYDDNFSIHDEPIENDNVISIVKKLQEAAKKYH
ncbi:16023_t:CDS:2 [Funneliformis caledonium]|uniref:16023_t:CDS:1 n=1 Tax=Funneliformis caledonium TaxID=1117310 RepID=A0A9N8ZVW1_9GLOM|nr:16023_t:CDS:2 [Funneliformis caledonium]